MADQFDLAALALLPDNVKRKIFHNVGKTDTHSPQQQVPQQQPQQRHAPARTASVAGEAVSAVRGRAVQLPAIGSAGVCVVDDVLSITEAQVGWTAAVAACRAVRQAAEQLSHAGHLHSCLCTCSSCILKSCSSCNSWGEIQF